MMMDIVATKDGVGAALKLVMPVDALLFEMQGSRGMRKKIKSASPTSTRAANNVHRRHRQLAQLFFFSTTVVLPIS
jgi:hypothetical protein